ncbi:unnamed protein product [Rotaria sp. Silwood1]|nr:unnamed protein product [Rotaria sp. Silwood1]CAF4727290.1 unnamed protein product [Rotaria sp. Silwood1]
MTNRDLGRCLVCDDVAIGINFGVPTCMPCKAFFRRNAVKLGTQEFVCRYDGDCIITHKYRRSCNCCRLAKCFRVGMRKSSILSDEEREARNKLVAINRLKRGQLTQPECLIGIQLSALFRMPSKSTQYLSSSDQMLLTNIFNAYENTCILARNTTLKNYPTVQHTSIHGFANEIAAEYEIAFEYLKLIPEFNNLTMDDRVRLVKNHPGTIIHINEPLMHPGPSNNLVGTWINIFGLDITKRLFRRNRIIEQFIFDPIILKVVLIIFVLSSGNSRNIDHPDMDSICDSPLSILIGQNIYVELLWKYLLSRLPDEKHAVIFFNRLVMFILFAQKIHLEVDDYIQNLKHEIEQMEPMMQSMWPKTDSDDDNNDMTIAQDVTP